MDDFDRQSIGIAHRDAALRMTPVRLRRREHPDRDVLRPQGGDQRG